MLEKSLFCFNVKPQIPSHVFFKLLLVFFKICIETFFTNTNQVIHHILFFVLYKLNLFSNNGIFFKCRNVYVSSLSILSNKHKGIICYILF